MPGYFYTWTAQRAAPKFNIVNSRDVILNVAPNDPFMDSLVEPVIDLLSTNFQAAFGHSCEHIKNAIKTQLDAMPLASPKAEHALKTLATERLLNYLKLPHGKILYTVSGAEAVENALKISRETTGKRYILARAKSYHGATLGAMSVTGDWRSQGHFSLGEWTVRIPEPHEDPDLSKTRAAIERVGAENCAAFCLETVTGMNGVIVPPKSWWAGIQKLADEYKIQLIVDEVSCGFGRTGSNFAFHDYNIRPDFVCMAKTITGGYIPFGALWVNETIASYYDDRVLACGLTNYAHPLGLAAMNAVLELLEASDFKNNKNALEASFASWIKKLSANPGVTATRRSGLMAAIELKNPLAWEDCLQAGIHVATKGSMIVVAPPFVMAPETLDAGMRKLEALIK